MVNFNTLFNALENSILASSGSIQSYYHEYTVFDSYIKYGSVSRIVLLSLL